MGAGGEEFAQSPGRLRDRIRPHHPDHVETLGAGRFGERRFQRRRCGRCGGLQKSRLA
jgi:hypothetical protein